LFSPCLRLGQALLGRLLRRILHLRRGGPLHRQHGRLLCRQVCGVLANALASDTRSSARSIPTTLQPNFSARYTELVPLPQAMSMTLIPSSMRQDSASLWVAANPPWMYNRHPYVSCHEVKNITGFKITGLRAHSNPPQSTQTRSPPYKHPFPTHTYRTFCVFHQSCVK
jgi:hypothetical protein